VGTGLKYKCLVQSHHATHTDPHVNKAERICATFTEPATPEFIIRPKEGSGARNIYVHTFGPQPVAILRPVITPPHLSTHHHFLATAPRRSFRVALWRTSCSGILCSWDQLKCDVTLCHTRRGNWRMEWVASTPHTTSEHCVASITTADAHTSAASSRQNWRPRPI